MSSVKVTISRPTIRVRAGNAGSSSNTAAHSFTADYAMTPTDGYGVLVAKTAGITFTAPPIASSYNRTITFKNLSTGYINIAADATIDDEAAPITLAPKEKLKIRGVQALNGWVDA